MTAGLTNAAIATGYAKEQSAKARTYEDGVEKAMVAILDHMATEGYAKENIGEAMNAIKAACLPPPEPEVVVTEEMIDAAKRIFFNLNLPVPALWDRVAEDIYQVMRHLEPKQEPGEGLSHFQTSREKWTND